MSESGEVRPEAYSEESMEMDEQVHEIQYKFMHMEKEYDDGAVLEALNQMLAERVSDRAHHEFGSGR